MHVKGCLLFVDSCLLRAACRLSPVGSCLLIVVFCLLFHVLCCVLFTGCN